MTKLFDELQNGTVSRRKLFELFPVAAGSAPLALAKEAKFNSPSPGTPPPAAVSPHTVNLHENI